MSRIIIAALIIATLLTACADDSAEVERLEAQTAELEMRQVAGNITPTPMLMPTRIATLQPTPTPHPCTPFVESRDRARMEMANFKDSAEWKAAEEAATTAVRILSDALHHQMDYHPDVYVRDEAWALSEIFRVQILRELHAMVGGILLTDDQGFELLGSGMSLSEFLQKEGKLIERNDDPDETVRWIREVTFRAELADYNSRIARRAGLPNEERMWSDVSRNWDSIADDLRVLQNTHQAAANSAETC